ncbi:hypothetical protein PRIPAC_93493 [Pristionchus pacificus]|uniref:Uncharacterized protein n=1 Tax=Pristionchus pacificus TaxID=54126 RepID=A0A2A6BR39_PRIPA|nr:hypothetical protein PRIPAC_93493 [Pristionchus pacificus]|eukprot:PDM68221.1 hypothetical protein PRIPAC_46265 [Pristionchus pacificus]
MKLPFLLVSLSLLILQIHSSRPVVDKTQPIYMRPLDHAQDQAQGEISDKHPLNKTITCHGACYFYIQKNDLIGGYLFSSSCELHKLGRFSGDNCNTVKAQHMIRCACKENMCNSPSHIDIPSKMKIFENLMHQRELAKGDANNSTVQSGSAK